MRIGMAILHAMRTAATGHGGMQQLPQHGINGGRGRKAERDKRTGVRVPKARAKSAQVAHLLDLLGSFHGGQEADLGGQSGQSHRDAAEPNAVGQQPSGSFACTQQPPRSTTAPSRGMVTGGGQARRKTDGRKNRP